MTKIKTVLFDLDNTLLTNHMSTFVPQYFKLLSEYAATHFADKQLFLQGLMQGTQAMMSRQRGPLTNRELFWQTFAQVAGQGAEELEPFFAEFYETDFCELENVCEMRPVAAEFVRYCFEQGLQVVVATNPLFPRRAVEHRLEWAGLPVDSFDFALVTTFENMHGAKPDTGYYEEILERVGATRDIAVMIGDDWEQDIIPANTLGIKAYWITDSNSVPPQADLVDGYGSLQDCFDWFRTSVMAGDR